MNPKDNIGNNTWQISRLDKNGWEQRENTEIFRGSYKDVIEKFNPSFSKDIKIKPADRYLETSYYRANDLDYDKYSEKVIMPSANQCMEKTLYYIYLENRDGINYINQQIRGAIKKGMNKIELYNINFIDSKEVYDKYLYFFSKQGYELYFDDTNMYKTYLKIIW